MTTALVLGGAESLRSDLDLVSCVNAMDNVVACNDAGVLWPGRLRAWASIHPRFFEKRLGEPGWRHRREANGYAPAESYYSQDEPKPPCPEYMTFTDTRLPGQWCSASSGIFAAKVALMDLGFDRVILCGIPMDQQPHWWDKEKKPWLPGTAFRKQVELIEEPFKSRITSVSGWTSEFFGKPEGIT